MALINVGNLEEAQKSFDKVLAMDGGNRFSYFNRGNAHVLIKNYKAAESDYQKALELQPSNPLYLFHLAHAQVLNGDRAKGM